MWAPLALLSALQGLALRPDPHESFLRDFASYGRYLFGAPALVFAGSWILPRFTHVVRQFVDSQLIRDADMPGYEALVASTRRLARWRGVDAAIIALSYISTAARSQALYPSGVSSWVLPLSGDGAGHVSLAGWWRTIVSQPLFNAILGVWLWRLLLWLRFNFRASQMNLRLVGAHPDQLGGVRFVLIPLRGFNWLAFGIGAVAAGSVAQAVLIDGQPLAAFRLLIGAQVLCVLALLAGPSLVWMWPLMRMQESSTFEYGRLASRLGQAFQRRWLQNDPEIGPDALEKPDFSATTDLYSITANVKAVNLFVLDARLLAMLAVATLLPYVPVVLAVMPIDEILQFVLKAFA
jgi:hypothetical protein